MPRIEQDAYTFQRLSLNFRRFVNGPDQVVIFVETRLPTEEPGRIELRGQSPGSGIHLRPAKFIHCPASIWLNDQVCPAHCAVDGQFETIISHLSHPKWTANLQRDGDFAGRSSPFRLPDLSDDGMNHIHRNREHVVEDFDVYILNPSNYAIAQRHFPHGSIANLLPYGS
ncbi:hypothetical protein BMS3Bbin04_00762 [bacterium BMS3Bbin04]|nr:hypothetical protein BMS3Bbin04_00762 [bacterium BMS3Bbin04]